MLSLRNIEVVYEDVVLVLRGVSMDIPDGDIVALLGPNGAGKTTTLRALTGLLGVHRGKITKGGLSLDGESLNEMGPQEIVRRGIKQSLEGRRIFAPLTVEENLRVGAHVRPAEMKESFERVYELFPVLAERRKSTAGLLSGGEQQMLAIGRALMDGPSYLLLDEPSLGLAPRLVQQLRELIVEINRQGTTILLVEQNAKMALSIATHGYVLENGKIMMDKPAAELAEDQDVQEFYLGLSDHGKRRSFAEVKHYKRRKRWLS